MSCGRQFLGMPDNCALCREQQPELYKPCRGEPDKIKSKTKNPKPIAVIPVKELSFDEVKKQVMDYIQTKGGKVQISEISEKLKIDIEFVTEILEE